MCTCITHIVEMKVFLQGFTFFCKELVFILYTDQFNTGGLDESYIRQVLLCFRLVDVMSSGVMETHLCVCVTANDVILAR